MFVNHHSKLVNKHIFTFVVERRKIYKIYTLKFFKMQISFENSYLDEFVVFHSYIKWINFEHMKDHIVTSQELYSSHI